MITCCEIALCLGITNVISLIIFAGYTLKVKDKQLELEKKNGKEQHQIDELKKEIECLQHQGEDSVKQIEQLKKKKLRG
jgi:peptidoglycan hydrolase CwlO-like protein